MLNKLFAEGMQYTAFLETDTEEIKQKAMKRWDTIQLSTEHIELFKEMKEGKLLAFMKLSCPDCMLILPLLEKIHQVNPNLEYSVLPQAGNEAMIAELTGQDKVAVPTILAFDKDEEIKKVFVEIPHSLKRRLKGLDEEDIEEMMGRYRRGFYNNEVVVAVMKLYQA